MYLIIQFNQKGTGMSVKRLKQYMEKVDEHEPINLNKFFRLLDSFNLSEMRKPSDIEAIKHQGDLYVVLSIAEGLNNQIRMLLPLSGVEKRAGMATQNKSHSVKVNGSFIIKRAGVSEPIIVMIDSQGEYRKDIEQPDTALLLENRQNFIDVDKTLAFLAKRTHFNVEHDMDVIFTEGNEISNSLHKPFLSQYKHLFLCLDIDLGGLLIAKNIASLLPNTSFDFLIPDDISSRLERVVEVKPSDYLDKVINAGRSHPELKLAVKLIKDSRKTLEQESYLYDY